MILIINTANLISDERYAKPIKSLLPNSHIRHYMELDHLPSNTTKIVISGNSVFSANMSLREIKSRFSWLDTFEGPVMGICAGQQIIAEYFGARLARHDARGLKKFVVKHRDKILKGVKDKFNGYVAHNFGAPLPEGFHILARANTAKAYPEYLAKHNKKPIYILSFHPEFSEKQIVENFAKL